jgi:hypothetical protein
LNVGDGIEMTHDSSKLVLPDMKSQVDSNGDDCLDYIVDHPSRDIFQKKVS